MFDLNTLLRDSVRALKPYSTARDEFKGRAEVFLDANENPYGSPVGDGLNRYPDPLHRDLKAKIAEIKGVRPEQIFLGNGSDEGIDLVYRAFCEPGLDEVITMPPTYGMYQVSAEINNVAAKQVWLKPDFSIDVPAVLEAVSAATKAIFVCSPNNPSGNSMPQNQVVQLLENFDGIVVVDEAYIDFAEQESMLPLLDRYPNLLVTQTFSKAWGLAALRLGVSYASEAIINVLNKIKPPYNVNEMTKRMVFDALEQSDEMQKLVSQTISERKRMDYELRRLSFVETVFPSDANFLLVRVHNARAVYNYLLERGIVIRDRSTQPLCEQSLRFTVGTPKENGLVLAALRTFEKENSVLTQSSKN